MTSIRARRIVLAACAVVASTSLVACTNSSTTADPTKSAGTPVPTATQSVSGPASANPNEAQITRLLDQGIVAAQAGKYDEAATTFNNVLLLDPANKYAFYNLALIAQTKSDSATAIANYDKALASDAAYTPAMYNKAILLEASKNDEAIAIYEKIVQINPQASTAWFRLGMAYDRKGDKTKAQAARGEAIKLDPTLAQVPTSSAKPSTSR
jgi:tetratricopeptide (TPR) repeat protein